MQLELGFLYLAVWVIMLWLGMMDKVSNSTVRFLHKSRFLKQDITDWDIVHREGDYGVFRIAMHQNIFEADKSLSGSPFWKPTIGILAIERDSEVITFPVAQAEIRQGDMLLCTARSERSWV